MVLDHETAAQDTTGRFERAASDAGVPFFVAAPRARREPSTATTPAAAAARHVVDERRAHRRDRPRRPARRRRRRGARAHQSAHQEAKAVWAIFGPAVGWSFVGTGLYAWRRRPENRTGALMVLLGFAWFLFTLDAANSPRSTRLRSSPAASGAASSSTSA